MANFRIGFDRYGRQITIRNDRDQLMESQRFNLAFAQSPNDLRHEIAAKLLPIISNDTCDRVIKHMLDSMDTEQLKEANKVLLNVNLEHKNKQNGQNKKECDVHKKKDATNKVETNLLHLPNGILSDVLPCLFYKEVIALKNTCRKLSILCLEYMNKYAVIFCNIMKFMDFGPSPIEMFHPRNVGTCNRYNGNVTARFLVEECEKKFDSEALTVSKWASEEAEPLILESKPGATAMRVYADGSARIDPETQRCLFGRHHGSEPTLLDMTNIRDNFILTCLFIFDREQMVELGQSPMKIILLLYYDGNSEMLMRPIQLFSLSRNISYSMFENYLTDSFEAKTMKQRKWKNEFQSEMEKRKMEMKIEKYDELIKFYAKRVAGSHWAKVSSKSESCGNNYFDTVIVSLTDIPSDFIKIWNANYTKKLKCVDM